MFEAVIDVSAEPSYSLLTMEDREQVLVTYDVEFDGEGRKVLVIGRDLDPVGFAGFSDRPGKVCVGPCHAAYAALNLAVQHGATTVEIAGASPELQGLLLPFTDQVADRVKVVFT